MKMHEWYCDVHEVTFGAGGNCAGCYDPAEATDLPPQRTPSEILDDTIDVAEKQLGGIELTHVRRMAERVYIVIAGCPHCGKRDASTSITELEIEKCCDGVLAGALVAGAKRTRAACLAGTCCDPLDRFVDGLRVRECLRLFTIGMDRDWEQQRDGSAAYHRGIDGKCVPTPPGYREDWFAAQALTTVQLTAARFAWSSKLRRKQQEARERERAQVVCDLQDEP